MSLERQPQQAPAGTNDVVLIWVDCLVSGWVKPVHVEALLDALALNTKHLPDAVLAKTSGTDHMITLLDFRL